MDATSARQVHAVSFFPLSLSLIYVTYHHHRSSSFMIIVSFPFPLLEATAIKLGSGLITRRDAITTANTSVLRFQL
jgi:hypothetical protein